jgi:metal-responsive CopG/Arc/MetJ family transcriptional regulator
MKRMRRTTISIDDELFARVDRLARERGCSFSAALSEIARAGLGDQTPKPYRIHPHESGRALIDNLDDLASAMDLLDEHGTAGR